MSLINTEVKPFKATAYHNGKFVPVTNEDLKGKWSVFVFYPADFTFVCPTELGDLADNYAAFQKLGVEIYGVSTDTHFTHKAWHDTSDTIAKVRYPLVADPTLLVCDEPTGDLDRETAEEVLGLLQQLNTGHGKTIIMVTHDPKAASFASRIVNLDKGALVPAPAMVDV